MPRTRTGSATTGTGTGTGTAIVGKGGRTASLFAFFALTTILPLSPLILRLSRQQPQPRQQQRHPPRPEVSSSFQHSASDPRSLTNGTTLAASEELVGSSAADDDRRTVHDSRREERLERREQKRKRPISERRAKRGDGGDDDGREVDAPFQYGVAGDAKEVEEAAPMTTTSVAPSVAAETTAGKGETQRVQYPAAAGTFQQKPRLRNGAAGLQRNQRKEEESPMGGREDREEVAREGEEKEEGSPEEERCVPVSECELCPSPEGGGLAVPTGCAATNRRRRFECRMESSAASGAGRRYRRYMPCDRTSADENYLVIRMQFICLVIGVLAMYVVRREKSLHGTSFDKRILAARNKITRGGDGTITTGAGTGTGGSGVSTKKKKKRRKKKGGATLSDYAYHSVAGAIIDEEEDDGEEVVEEEEEANATAVERTPPPASLAVGDPGDGAGVEGDWRHPTTTTTPSTVPTNLVRMASV